MKRLTLDEERIVSKLKMFSEELHEESKNLWEEHCPALDSQLSDIKLYAEKILNLVFRFNHKE